MKNIMLGLLFASSALLSSSAFAQEETPQMQCQSIGYLAEVVMTVRQGGGSLEDLMEIINRPQHAEVKDIAKVIINGAYDFPVLSSDKDKEQIATEFATYTYTACIEGIS